MRRTTSAPPTRKAGPHTVVDIKRTGLPFWVRCIECGCGWPEGGHYPEKCEP